MRALVPLGWLARRRAAAHRLDPASLRLVLPGGRQPQPGETVTVRFDPNARRKLVLLEENVEVRDMAQNLLGG